MKTRRLTWAEGFVIFGIVMLLISILMPSLNRMRETGGRQRCPSNLKQIGQAILLYSIDHQGAMPDSLATILRTADLVPEVFVCPSDDATKANDKASFRGDSTDCSYVYIGDRHPTSMNGIPANALTAFDRDDTHDRDGINALFADGHVEFLPFAPAGKLPAWWADVQDQIARGVRPVILPAAATQPTR